MLGRKKQWKETNQPDIVYYAPHHGTFRREKLFTKLRVVSIVDKSLILLQHNSAIIQNSLHAIMVSF